MGRFHARLQQRGIATLLFICIFAIGLAALGTSSYHATQGAQKIQRAGHTVTQAEMLAWSGITLLSKAVEKLPPDAEFTKGDAVTFTGAPAGLSAVYQGKQNGLHIFEVIGASAGAKSILRAAIKSPISGGANGDLTLPSGITLRGQTTITGDVNYTGSAPKNLNVVDGSLTMTGSVTGLNEVCATGNITIGSQIQVSSVCANGNITFNGAASVTDVKARGDITLAGGSASSIGTLWSNGNVILSGGAAAAGAISAWGNVSVTGGNARATTIRSQGNVDWTSALIATSITANGNVDYRPSGKVVATDIEARGNVQVTSARNVRTQGSTTMVGFSGQGITGRLDGQGQLNGDSWGTRSGAVVSAGTVGSIATPIPPNVRVTVSPGYTVNITPVSIPEVPVYSPPKASVDAYALRERANFAFSTADASGNPRVTVKGIHEVPDGDYYIAAKTGAGENYLCKSVSGTVCTTPIIKICEGYSAGNKCFKRTTAGRWSIEGKTMLPGVLWFEGGLDIGNGTWVNTFLATGDITTSGGTKVYSPNYLGSNYACQGKTNATPAFSAWQTYGFPSTAYAKQLCAGTPLALNGASIGNVALLSGGFNGNAYVGGNVTLGNSNEIYGAVLAGQYVNTGGSTVLAGSVLSAAQGGSAAQSGNSQGGSTTIKVDGGGSTAYNPDKAPCMHNCAQSPVSNIVWAGPV